MTQRYFKSLDSLLAAAELARLGRHAEAAKFLVQATALPCYREMAEAVTDEQEQNQQQEQADADEQQDEQEQQQQSAVLSAALARVIGTEVADADEQTGDDAVEDDDTEEQQQEEADAGEDDEGFDDLGIDLDDESEEPEPTVGEQQVQAALASRRGAKKPASSATASLSERQARLARNKHARA